MSEATQAPPKAGTFCWNELMTNDKGTCGTFYSQLFGWTTEEMPMESGTYTMWKSGDTTVGGMLEMKGPEFQGVPNHWMSYIAVDDIDASTKKAESLGATVCCPPTEVPNMGRFSVIQDPAGSTFAMWQGVKS